MNTTTDGGNQQRSGLRGDPGADRTSGVDTRDQEIRDLRSQRDALLSALKGLVAETIRCDCPGLYGVGQDEPVMEAAKAAIALVEGR